MTTQPKPIPPRGTDKFSQYVGELLIGYNNGLKIEGKLLNGGEYRWITCPSWAWDLYDYRIAQTPPPKTRRYETREEFMALVPTHGSFLVRRKSDGESATARIHINVGHHCVLTHDFPNIGPDNFRDYEKSLDGGKSWHELGV